jgi:hypothetical protein
MPPWFNRYYNVYLIGQSVFTLDSVRFEGAGLEEILIQGKNRPCVKLSRHIRIAKYISTENYWLDRETGLLSGTTGILITTLVAQKSKCY